MPTADDPAVEEARRKQQIAAHLRKPGQAGEFDQRFENKTDGLDLPAPPVR